MTSVQYIQLVLPKFGKSPQKEQAQITLGSTGTDAYESWAGSCEGPSVLGAPEGLGVL